jgi:hypothetical protein
MAIIATSTGASNYTPVPAGNYVARCFSMVHIGTAKDTFEGREKLSNKVRLTFELPTETKEFKEGEGEKPFTVSKEFTLSMHEKAGLRKSLESWRGKGFTEEEAKAFDITKLLGKPCMLNIIHKEKQGGGVNAVISSISSMPKGLQCPDQVNPNFEFSVAEFDIQKFATLPEFLQTKIKETNEYKAMNQPGHIDTNGSQLDDEENELPF